MLWAIPDFVSLHHGCSCWGNSYDNKSYSATLVASHGGESFLWFNFSPVTSTSTPPPPIISWRCVILPCLCICKYFKNSFNSSTQELNQDKGAWPETLQMFSSWRINLLPLRRNSTIVCGRNFSRLILMTVTWKPWRRSSGNRWRLGAATVGEGCSARWSRAWQEADAVHWARCTVLYSERYMVTILFSARNGTTYWTTGGSASRPASVGVLRHLPHPSLHQKDLCLHSAISGCAPEQQAHGGLNGGPEVPPTVYCLRTVGWSSVSNNLMVWFLVAPYLWNIEPTLHYR